MNVDKKEKLSMQFSCFIRLKKMTYPEDEVCCCSVEGRFFPAQLILCFQVTCESKGLKPAVFSLAGEGDDKKA